jgi:hypothetical protein
MAKRKKSPETVSGGYTAIPWKVLDSQAFIGATDRAKSLLYALMRQHNGSNNGRLQLTNKWLSEHGWPSAGMNSKSREELVDRGLIIQTRRGGLNFGSNWYALTWVAITNFVGLEVSAQTYHPGAWAGCSLKNTARRNPPKRETPSGVRNSSVPTTGIVKSLAIPTTGTKKALFSHSAIPYTGNNVVTNTPSEITRGRSRIVGKVGRSGNPKQIRGSQIKPTIAGVSIFRMPQFAGGRMEPIRTFQ